MPNKVCVWILVANLGLALSELKTIVDLTWDFSNETIYWTGISPFKYTKVVGTDERGYWYSMNEFCAGEHGGTHFDAPYHFSKEGWKVADVPIERLIAQGATIDLSHNDTKTLLPQHLDSWVRLNGEFENNTILLVRFGWSRFWPNRTQYMGVDSEGKVNFPGKIIAWSVAL
jgi:kynurenine formamidase